MSLNQCTACGADLGPDCLETRCPQHEEPIALLVEEDRDGTWGLWVGLAGENPITSPYGFCVGTGRTKDEAIERGRVSLHRACELLAAKDVAEYKRKRVN